MAYENLKLGVSPLTKTVFAGRINKRGDMWVQKVDVTEQFLGCCMQYFQEGEVNTISADGKPIAKITLKRLDKEKSTSTEEEGDEKSNHD